MSAYVETRMLTKPNSELALAYFGTSATRNELHDEAAAAGDPSQYLHISVEHALQRPGLSMLRSLRSVPHGTGIPDFVDALTVALDALYKAILRNGELEGPRVAKRIVLVSDFASHAKDDPGHVFKHTLVTKLAQRAVSLDVVALRSSSADPTTLSQLKYLLDKTPHVLREVGDACELAGAFKAREVTATAFYSGPFTISEEFEFRVKVAKKSNLEKLPTLGKESPLDTVDPEATHELTLAREYRLADEGDEGEEVPDEERVKVYRYGKQLVPVSAEDEGYLRYAVPRGLQLLGFVASGSIPRHHYMKECWVVVGEKDNPTALNAMAALATAAHARAQVAVVRYVPRAWGAIHVCVATPVPGAGSTPAHLLLNVLPFAEDVRDFRFPGFDREECKPSPAAAAAAQQLVDAMALQQGDWERLAPEHVPNPSLHAFLRLVASKALGEGAVEEGSGSDVLASDRAAEMQWQGMPGCEARLAAALGALRTATALGALAAGEGPLSGGRLQPEAAVQHMHESLEAGGPARVPLKAMQRHIFALLKASPGDRDFAAALICATALREAAVQQYETASWNSLLLDARRIFGSDPSKAPFLEDLQRAGLTAFDDVAVKPDSGS